MSPTQKASVIPAIGASLVVQDRPIPSPSSKQILVKVNAAAVNPLDNAHRYVSLVIKEYPAILGCDGSGVVEAVGSDVQNFKKGDRVFFQGNFGLDNSTFQQYALADANLVGRTPSNISDDQASTVPSAVAAALVSLFLGTGFDLPVNGPTVSNTPIVILGGAGSVGRATIQLARIAGFSPIITTASKAHADALKLLGATHVFERTVSPETVHTVIKASGHPLRLVVDDVSNAETHSLAFKLLTTQPDGPSDGLQLKLVLPPSEELLALNKARSAGPVNVNVIFGSVYASPELAAPIFEVTGKWLEEGTLAPARVQVVEGGLASVTEALDIVAKGASGFKVVIRPQE